MFSYQIDDDVELCLPEEQHAEEAHALVMQSFEYLRIWLPWVTEEYSLEDTRQYIRQNLQQFAEGQGFAVLVVFQGRIAGQIGYNKIDWPDHKTEIGYWLGAAFQGKGLITKACRALIDHAFTELELNRIEIQCAVDNRQSRRIPERLGFKQEGLLRQAEWVHDHFNDLVMYGLLMCEWQAQCKP